MFWRRPRQEPTRELTPGRFFRFWRWVARVVGVLGLLILFAVVAGPIVTGYLLERERDRLRELGEPLTLEEVVPRLPPGARNAADVYQQAFDALDLTEEEGELLGHLNDEEPPAGWAEAMRVALARNGEYFSLLEEAAALEACVFPVDWEKGADIEQPHLAQLRTAARMASARAVALAVDGRAEEALQSSEMIPVMVQHLSQEPTVVGQLVRCALLGIGRRGVEQTLSRCDPSAEACRELCDAFGDVGLADSALGAARGERAIFGEWAFSSVREDIHGEGAWLVSITTDLDERLYLRAMQEQIEALDLPWPEARHEARAVTSRVENNLFPFAIVTLMTLPALDRVAESCRIAEGRRDVCQIGLALRGYQAEHGLYPNSLEALAAEGWEIPRDSFTDEPYRYRREGDGFLVWGVGPDLDDDGGKPFAPSRRRTRPRTDEEQERADDYDIVFRCER